MVKFCETSLSSPVKVFFTDRSVGHFVIYVRVCLVFLSFHCSDLVTYYERALCSLVCDVLLCLCHFPMWCPGSSVVLDCIDF